MSKKQSLMIRLVRAYDVDPSLRGFRVLVDRLRPRGVSKAALELDYWAKELAPSTELRKWFNHDAQKWKGFEYRYRKEMSGCEDALRSLIAKADAAPLVWIYAAKDQKHNHALVLSEVLQEVSTCSG